MDKLLFFALFRKEIRKFWTMDVLIYYFSRKYQTMTGCKKSGKLNFFHHVCIIPSCAHMTVIKTYPPKFSWKMSPLNRVSELRNFLFDFLQVTKLKFFFKQQ